MQAKLCCGRSELLYVFLVDREFAEGVVRYEGGFWVLWNSFVSAPRQKGSHFQILYLPLNFKIARICITFLSKKCEKRYQKGADVCIKIYEKVNKENNNNNKIPFLLI